MTILPKPLALVIALLALIEPATAAIEDGNFNKDWKFTLSDSTAYHFENYSINEWRKMTWEWQDVNRHWNYDPAQMVIVEAYTNCEESELFVNGKSYGRQKLSDQPDHIHKWAVPYKAGKIEVKSYNRDEVAASDKIESCGTPSKIRITPDRKSMSANEEDVVHYMVQIEDAKGRPVRNQNIWITFEVDGNYKLLGVDNGYSGNVNPFQSYSVMTHNGECMLLLQSTDKGGDIKVRATAKGCEISDAPIVTIK